MSDNAVFMVLFGGLILVMILAVSGAALVEILGCSQ